MSADMAVHEFGILPRDPAPGERYDYGPERYGCVAVDDEWMEPLARKLTTLPVCWQTLDQPGMGLDCCGITLIPPSSIPAVIAALDAAEVWTTLVGLLEEAKARDRFVIHYGL